MNKKSITILGLLLVMSLSLSAQQATDSLPAAYVSASSPVASAAPEPQIAPEPSEIGLQTNIDLTGDITYNPALTADPYATATYTSGGFSIGLSAGVRCNRYFYFGAGFDFTSEWGKTTLKYTDEAGQTELPVQLFNMVVPIFANARAYWPNKSICTPFWDVQIGGYLGTTSRVKTDYAEGIADELLKCYIPKNGFYFSTGLGINLSIVTIGAGYKLFHQYGYNCNYGYFKVGVSLFRPVNIYRYKH